MTPARDPKELFSMITSRVHSVRRRLCICISVQQEACGKHLGGIWEATWRRNPKEGILEKESLRMNDGGII